MPTHGDQHAEERRDLERLEVVRVVRTGCAKFAGRRTRSEGRTRPAAGTSTRPPAPPARRRTRRDRDLRRQQRVRQPRRAEDDALFHRQRRVRASTRSRLLVRRFERSQDLVAALAPRRRAPSSRSFLPANTCSSSSSITSRPCTKLPKRRPLRVGGRRLLVSCVHGDVGARVLVVEAGLLGQLVGGHA